jgi:hypothetical protein
MPADYTENKKDLPNAFEQIALAVYVKRPDSLGLIQ